MKKFFTLVALCAGVATVNAQETAIAESSILDNWYVGINGGVITPLHGNMIDNARGNYGVEIGRFLTPVFGLAVEGRANVNTTQSNTSIDQSNVTGLMKFNLNNLFFGYDKEPDMFEVVANYGFGWGHGYRTMYSGCDVSNFFTSKAGLDFNFNLGKSKAWQINVKPAVVFAMPDKFVYDSRFAALEVNAGVTYKFLCSNGSHNFVRTKLYDQNEVDGLNRRISSLNNDNNAKQNELNAKNNELNVSAAEIEQLQKDLKACREQGPKTIVKNTESKTLESVVTYGQGRSTVDNSQLPNVERISTYLKNHKDAKVIIKGYASPEGSAEVNAKVAASRADAVKTVLIKKYGISADRISAEGCGVGNSFSEPDWNRVAICTIEESSK